jgi:hypothetical protein
MNVDELYTIAYRAFKDALDQRINRIDDETEIAPKFYRGTMILQPADERYQSKEIDLDVFFRKIVSVRNNLRVLEQKINAHTGLSEAEKVELQGYITRSYGSLTTFNVLFRDDEDKFVGSKSD